MKPMDKPLDVRDGRILLIDDESDNLIILSSYLTENGYHNLVLMSDPLEAVQCYGREVFDLVLLDIMMPKLDGFEVMKAFQEGWPDRVCPILVLTARQDEETKLRALKSGASDFLHKPFLEEELLARTKNLLNASLLHKQLKFHNQRLDDAVKIRTIQLEQRSVLIYQSRQEIIKRLALAAEYRDNETGKHVLRMSHYSEIIAKALGMPSEKTQLLLQASPMHDVGKIGIPDAILLKPGVLSREEWVVMKTHAEIGAKILDNSPYELLEFAKIVALTHHERWDGEGYPNRIKGEEIPLIGRVVAVADVFDALTSKRPYKSAWPVERALKTIEQGSGSHFDPEVVSAFMSKKREILSIKDQYSDEGQHSVGEIE